jgi:hypothetical protein
MQRPDKISRLRREFVSELKSMEAQLSQQLDNVRNELSTLGAGSEEPRRQSRVAQRSTQTKNKTVSILTGKTCPKCGKKGHDLRWHRWHDRKTAQNGRRAS